MSEKASESSAPSDVPDETDTDAAGRSLRVETITRNHILASLGVGLVPIPIADIVGVLAVNLDLIRSLSKEYGVPFQQDRGKAILTSLLGGLFPVAVGGTVISLLKFIPIVGQTTGAVALPVLAGASTYAVSKVFVRHYESGGSLVDLDPTKVKDFFSKQFGIGKKVAADLKNDTPSAAA